MLRGSRQGKTSCACANVDICTEVTSGRGTGLKSCCGFSSSLSPELGGQAVRQVSGPLGPEDQGARAAARGRAPDSSANLAGHVQGGELGTEGVRSGTSSGVHWSMVA